MSMSITKIEPEWMHGYANRPHIVVTVDHCTPYDEFMYKVVPKGATKNCMLISTNNDPWVQFVFIANPEGRPSTNGALGGEYKLVSGDVFKSRSGWSSRSGIINTKYREHIKEEIVKVTLREEGERSGWHGFHLYYYDLYKHPLFPKDLFLVREENTYLSDEVYWHISTDPTKVVKPPKP